MCGILVILGLSNEKKVQKMLPIARELSKLQNHRGSDYSGVLVLKNNILCHERLVIIDINGGAQPLIGCSKNIALNINGEIYNHKQLKEELKENHKFTTESDCEVLLHLYEEYGPDFLTRFNINGMFAFVIVDVKNNMFLAARDHVGICPLYMGKHRDKSEWFSSELKTLKYCQTYENFLPGHYYTNDGFSQYYKPNWLRHNYLPSQEDINISVLRKTLKESIKSHMMSDVPYGVLLSGGLDSSIVASIASSSMIRGTLPSFCIGLEESPDLIMAQKVADFIGTKHHSWSFTVEEGLKVLDKVIKHIETYDITTIRASVPMYILAQKIKAMGIKMVLSGEGADEIFGGYLYFHKAPNKKEFFDETVRKVKNLHLYDCLRANKSMLAFGVECRVPFLDRTFLDFAMEINPKYKMINTDSKSGEYDIEKYILRKTFENYLPQDMLWRQKEQFSDGVGYRWINSLKKYAE